MKIFTFLVDNKLITYKTQTSTKIAIQFSQNITYKINYLRDKH